MAEGHVPGTQGLTNMVHWRREWQTTSVFLPSEPREQYEKAKKNLPSDEYKCGQLGTSPQCEVYTGGLQN